MDDITEMEAYGAMIHRQLVEERSNKKDCNKLRKEALTVAVEALEVIELSSPDDEWSPNRLAKLALEKIAKIMEK